MVASRRRVTREICSVAREEGMQSSHARARMPAADAAPPRTRSSPRNASARSSPASSRCPKRNGPCPCPRSQCAVALARARRGAIDAGRGEDRGGASMDGIARAVTSVMSNEGSGRQARRGWTPRRRRERRTRRRRCTRATSMDVNVRFDSCESFSSRDVHVRRVRTAIDARVGVGEEEHGVACKEAGGDGYNRLVERLIDLRTKTSGDASGGAEALREWMMNSRRRARMAAPGIERNGIGSTSDGRVAARDPTPSSRARARRRRDREFLNVTASQLRRLVWHRCARGSRSESTWFGF